MNEKSMIVKIAGLNFDVTLCGMILLTCLIIFAFVFICSRNMKLKPTGKQNALEWVVDFVRNVVSDNLPSKEVNNYHLLGFTLFLFVLISNLIGLITKIAVHDVNGDEISFWKSPTADPMLTLTLALTVILLTSFFGVKKFGFKGYFVNSYIKPVAFLLPVKLMEEVTNVLTLSLRLYGNIFAGEVLLTLISNLAASKGLITFALALPLEMIWQGFSVFIGSIQAYVFLTLSMVYLSHKIEVEE